MKKKNYTSPWLLSEQVEAEDVMTASSEGFDNEIPIGDVIGGG